MKPAFSLIPALLLSACAAGPDYALPVTPKAADAPFIGSAAASVSTADAEDAWWRLYRDPVLDGLIADALAANTDIRVAAANLARAQAALRGARSDRLPQTDIQASTNYGRVAERQTIPGTDREGWVVDAGIAVSYEVDLAGRVSRSIEAARGDVGAAAYDADAVRVAIVAQTTQAYVDAASSAAQAAVAERIVALLDQSLRLTGKRAEAGRATQLDVARIATLREQRRALVPPLLAQRESALFRLATLTGRAPRDLPPAATMRTTTPAIDRAIPIGDGAALLSRRPDVRAAERRLAADTARIGVATAELYPRISLGGSIGSTGAGLSDLFGGGPLRFLLGPLISWSFPNQAAARARIAGAKAETQASLARFDGTVLTALEETETALARYGRELERRQALGAARDQASKAVRITRARQREGQIDFLDVLDAERTSADAEADLAASDARVALAQVDLFRALGGGWQTAG